MSTRSLRTTAAVAIAAVGLAVASSAGAFGLPPGVYGIIAIPTVHVQRHGLVRLTISCPHECRGTVRLVADLGTGAGRRERSITNTGRFSIRAAKGGTVSVTVQLNRAGQQAFRASHDDLETTALMHYPKTREYPAQTDRYPVTLV